MKIRLFRRGTGRRRKGGTPSPGHIECARCRERLTATNHTAHRCDEQHLAYCGPARGFAICYCACPQCLINGVCICMGCKGDHRGPE